MSWQIMCFGQTSKTTTTTKHNIKHKKILDIVGNWLRELLHQGRMRYLCITENIVFIYWCVNILLLVHRRVSLVVFDASTMHTLYLLTAAKRSRGQACHMQLIFVLGWVQKLFQTDSVSVRHSLHYIFKNKTNDIYAEPDKQTPHAGR